MDNEKNPVLGIDLGTTFSAIARWDGSGARPYEGTTGDKAFQSVIYIDPKTNQVLVGKIAYNRGLINPEFMVLGVKRMMDDASQKINIGGAVYTPVQLSSFILKQLYSEVRAKFPKGLFKSRGTVVTVPYYFKAHQCENTRKAAEIAKIECVGLIQEPISAALCYALQLVQDHPEREEFTENILVFDLGGGTFDLTLFRMDQKKDKLTFQVLATGGDDRLGGMDFDQSLIKLLLKKSRISLDGLSPLDERKARQKLIDAAITAKIALSMVDQQDVIVADVLPGKHMEIAVSRREFEDCICQYVDKIKGIIDGLWDTSRKKPGDVDRVIKVGGSSLMPCMGMLLTEMVGEGKVYGNIDPSLSVASGAAIYAAYLDDRSVFNREIEIQQITSHSLGVETAGGRFHILVPRNRKTPCEVIEVFGTELDNETSVNINVYQGSASLVKDNSLIGTISISGLPPKPKGQLDIEITFKVSEDNTLSAIAEVEGKRKTATFKFG